MKVAVYQIDTVAPQHNSDEYFEILDILNLPSLKYGTAEFLGKFSHWTTKGKLKQMKAVSAKYYDRAGEFWIEGLLLMELDEGKKMFAQYAGKL